MNPRIRIMLDSREVEELAAQDAEILGMWGKATRTAQTAVVKALDDDPDARFTLLYQSALQAGLGASGLKRLAERLLNVRASQVSQDG